MFTMHATELRDADKFYIQISKGSVNTENNFFILLHVCSHKINLE